MPKMWMDVDVALTGVPVNLLALTDDTDFKTREVSIAYNAAGMDLVWNFTTTAGVTTQTAVTPTTSGNYDWANKGDGMYTIEIPASGGISINNDTEGFGWFTGLVTGVLPWRGPVIGFRAAALNNALVDGGDNLDVNVAEISDDSTAADNLELGYDTTGLTGDTFPATQAQVGNIASGTAATNTTAASVTVTTGVEVNAVTDTVELDGTVHEVNPSGGNTEFYYQFNVGANGVPVSVQWEGYANNILDSYSIFAWNWSGAAWEQVGAIAGAVGSTTGPPQTFDLTTGHVGTGANVGLVRWRVLSTDGTGFNTDRVLCSFATTFRSAGYEGGAIWYDDSVSNTNTVRDIDGVSDNPVSTWAAALTLNATLGFNRFHIANGSTVTLSANSDNYTLAGDAWTLVLGTRSIDSAHFNGAAVTGIGTAVAAAAPEFHDCTLGAVTLPACILWDCGIGEDAGQFTAGSSGEYILNQCFSMIPGSGSPVLVFTGLGASTGINNRAWKGGATYVLDSDCTLSHEVVAGGITAITTGGADVEIRGITRSLMLTLSAAETAQFVGVTGPIILAGTTTAIVNLYGVSASLADSTSAATVTDLTVSQLNVADETLKRGVSNVEDAADTTSLAAIILAILESSVAGTTWTIRKTGGATFVSKTITVDSAADPITGVT